MSEPSVQTSPPPPSGQMQFRSDQFLRGCMILVLIKLGALFLGGMGIFMIFMGLWVALTRPLIYWPRTRAFAANLLGMQLAQNPPIRSSAAANAFANIYHILISIVFATIGFYIIYMGVKILWEDGFLNQNLIYNLFFRP